MNSGFRLRRPTFSILSPYPYPVRGWETCPRGKGICSKAKLDELFSFLPQVVLASPCMRQRGGARRGSLLWEIPARSKSRFPLTAQKLSRRIVERARGHCVLNALRRSNLRQMWLHRDRASHGNSHVSRSVTGNVRYGSLAEHFRIVAEEADSMLVRRTDRSLRPI